MCRQKYSLIKSWQIEGWSAFLQGPVEFGLSVFACEDQPFFFFFWGPTLIGKMRQRSASWGWWGHLGLGIRRFGFCPWPSQPHTRVTCLESQCFYPVIIPCSHWNNFPSVSVFLYPVDSSVHGDCPGKNTGVSCHALLQGIFPTQGSNLGLPHCRQILYHLSHRASPRILEW